MALTNAERQARYRAKLKAKASIDALGERTREAVDEAIASIWAFFNRPSPSGDLWADIDGFETLADYQAMLAASPGTLVNICRDLTTYSVGLHPQEARAIQLIVDIADVIAFAGGRQGTA